jgi:hypothetical protein
MHRLPPALTAGIRPIEVVLAILAKGSQPVAMPRSLSSLKEWVSNTISIDIGRG